MTVNEQKGKRKKKSNSYYAQPLNYKVGVIFFFRYTKNRGMTGGGEKT